MLSDRRRFSNACFNGEVNDIVAISLFKRRYMSDAQPITEMLKPSNVGLKFLQAGLVTFALAGDKYNKYLDRKEKAYENGEEDLIEEFDYEKQKVDSLYSFCYFSTKTFSVTLIRYAYQQASMIWLPERIVDRLTKDVQKSLIRKLDKFNRLEACKRLWFTCVGSTAIPNLSFLTFDILYEVFDLLKQSQRGSVSNDGALNVALKRVKWLMKKATLYSTTMAVSAAGYAVGAYLNESHGGYLLSMCFEALSMAAVGTLLHI